VPRQPTPSRGSELDPNLTALLADWAAGNETAADEVVPRIYRELRRRARYFMARERAGHLLQTSALVNEAYIRLNGAGTRVPWRSRAHFFLVACRVMRHVLVDIARKERNQKRGGQMQRVTFSEGLAVAVDRPDRLLALHDALSALSGVDRRKAQVVEMRFFGGMSGDEIADALNVSPETVKRDWKFSKAWLGRELRHRATRGD
jgi:RNA polymerase sigma-70 factor (ECF subfamily)